jgi:hypothetical protein
VEVRESAAARAILCTVSADSEGLPESTRSAQHRYGIVLALTILAVLFSILAPNTPVGRALAVLLQCATLLAVIVTSRESAARRVSAVLAAVAVVALAVAAGDSSVSGWVGPAGGAAAVAGVLVVLTRGVVRLIGERGVTVQAVAGALTTYLLIGLEFALVIRVLVGVVSHQYFDQISNATATQSQEIYFSFTTLTTTGYGDLTPSLNAGRALSVLEMLTGQIYLVTVIGLLVGNMRRRPSQTTEA